MLNRVIRTGMTMKRIFDLARKETRRVVFAEGEEEMVLQAAQQAVEEGIARPILIGRRAVIERRLAGLGLSLRLDEDCRVVDPQDNPDREVHYAAFYQRAKRRGFTPAEARVHIRGSATALAAILLRTGEADAMISGTIGRYRSHLEQIELIVGRARGVEHMVAMTAIVLPSGPVFIADTDVQPDPDTEALVEITALCADEVRRFGIEPKVALLSHSNFGSHQDPSARKMHHALCRIQRAYPDLEVEGEMRADLALSAVMRQERFPDSQLEGRANLLIMPNQDAANIAFNLLKVMGDGTAIGPILLGAAKSAHVLTPGITVRGLLNMTALAAVQAR
jgi:malate dehydrogenase (oxaloacetate-decarboxylating)(NADP+)